MFSLVNGNFEISASSQDPVGEAKDLINQLTALMTDPQKNEAAILSLNEKLEGLVVRNPGAFSKIEKYDVYTYCSAVQFSFEQKTDLYKGEAEGCFENVKLDFAQTIFPVVPPIPESCIEDLFEIDSELGEQYPDTNKIKTLLAEFEKEMPAHLPVLVKEKIEKAILGLTQYIENPSDQYALGAASGYTECALYMIWKDSPLPPA